MTRIGMQAEQEPSVGHLLLPSNRRRCATGPGRSSSSRSRVPLGLRTSTVVPFLWAPARRSGPHNTPTCSGKLCRVPSQGIIADAREAGKTEKQKNGKNYRGPVKPEKRGQVFQPRDSAYHTFRASNSGYPLVTAACSANRTFMNTEVCSPARSRK